MKTVMVSGHFDPFHDIHLAYIKQAANYGDFILCIVSSDKQLMMKKDKVNIPDYARVEILMAILRGLGIRHKVVVNYLDKDSSTIAKSLRWWKPEIFFRGNDKMLETMPPEEERACN